MFMNRFAAIIVLSSFSVAFCDHAWAQVLIDIDSDAAKKANDIRSLNDLTVNDAALFYSGSFCVQNNMLYMPGWLQPADLAHSSYAQTGLMIRVEVLPAKKLRARFIDGAQAQEIAQGKPTAPSTMTNDEYNKAIIDTIYGWFRGGFFGTHLCEEEQRQSPLRKLNLFAVESLNGYTKISDLLASVTPLRTPKSPTQP
jgi:hypothetical protein